MNQAMPERLAVCFRGYICRGSPAAVKPESSSSTCLQVRKSCGFNRGRFQCCFKNLLAEIAEVKPKVVILLGEKVCSAVEKKLNIKLKRWRGFEYFAIEYNGIWYLPVQHPSYIYVYKRKEAEKYVEKVAEAIGRTSADYVCTIFNAVMNTASEKVVKKNKKI